jgi:hypothetical protein
MRLKHNSLRKIFCSVTKYSCWASFLHPINLRLALCNELRRVVDHTDAKSFHKSPTSYEIRHVLSICNVPSSCNSERCSKLAKDLRVFH